MNMRFAGILAKIDAAPILTEPFPHVEIQDLFEPELFAEIIASPEIKLPAATSDRELVDTLKSAGWKPIPFPGTTENVETYLKWHEHGGKVITVNTCEGYGITFRLFEPESPIIAELKAFLDSEPFRAALMRKFDVKADTVTYDAGIQKDLDGYEISPHPDIRRKALTYMVNINPADNSEALNYHTHYMTFAPEKKYVGSYWEHNAASERCWVPWDWCATTKQQVRNNSIVIFSPSHDTLHAVKADYDHLPTQRTQLYGNFWYDRQDPPIELKPTWEHYVVREADNAALKRSIPPFVKTAIKVLTGRRALRAGKRSIDV